MALVGNPNTGKSTLFSALSGVQQQVGNYSGVTVEKKFGRVSHAGRDWELIDLPGTYSLLPRSPDEAVAVDLLLGRMPGIQEPDVLVAVVSAVSLERNLYLLSQIFELGRPTVIALTMLDVAASRGQSIDVGVLSARLGVPVVAVQAHRDLGLDALKAAVEEAARSPVSLPPSPLPEPFHEEVSRIGVFLSSLPGDSTEPWPRSGRGG
ncbi:MAG: FeoB small GTPase domain-containing protein [Isosphaeraceae bacterium]